MASPSQALVLRFGTDLEPARRNLAAFAGQAATSLATVGTGAVAAAKNLKSVGDSASTVGNVLKTSAGLFAQYKVAMFTASLALSAYGAAAAVAAEQVEKLNAVAKGAKDSDTSSGFWQSWVRQAQEAGIATKDAAAALTAARSAVRRTVDDEGQSKGNPILDILGEQAITNGRLRDPYAQFRDAKDVEGRIKAVIQAIRELNSEVQAGGDSRLNLLGENLAQKTFGSADFAKTIREAKTDIDSLQAAGLAAGTIFDDSLVKRAKELDERLKNVRIAMADGLAPILGDLAVLGLEIKSGWIDIESFIAASARAAGSLYAGVKRVADLIPELNLGTKAAQMLKDLGLSGEGDPMERLKRDLRFQEKTGRPASSEIPGTRDERFDPRNAFLPATFVPPANVPVPAPRPAPSAFRRGTDTPTAAKSSSPSESFDQVERYLSQLEKSVDVLKAEAAAYGKSNEERIRLVALARAEAAARERGTPLTEAERQKVLSLADAEGQLRKQMQERLRAQEDASKQAQFFSDTLYSGLEKMIMDGGKLTDVINDMTRALMKAALQAALLGEGPLAGLMGTRAGIGATGASSQGGLLGNIFSSFFGGGGSSGSIPYTGGLYHSGGFVGSPSASRAVDPGLWSGAPRFHSGGLVSGEVPIIAKAGELVLNAAQQANVARSMGGGGTQIIVNNNNGSQVSTRESTGNGGMKQIEVMVDRALAKAVATNSPGAQALQNQYSLNRAGGRR